MRAVLTGASDGIGAATARLLCPLVDVLVLHGLEAEADVRPQLEDLRRRNPMTEVHYHAADYGRLADVERLAAAIRDDVDGLELLVNNAGRPGPARRTLSADGHEVTLQTNHLAPVALTAALRPLLERAERARVINVASATHYTARLDLDDLELERGYSAVTAYARSKLALVTYSCWLADRLDPRRLEVVSLHPGVISTGLLHAMFGAGGDAVEHGARNVFAVAQRPPGISGQYFDEGSPAEPNPFALDRRNQERLMALTAGAVEAAGLTVV